MNTTVAIVAMGEMGAAVGRVLVEHGARVITCLAGRSEASAKRAAKAGVEVIAGYGAMTAEADIILSIVPPSRASEFACELLPHLWEAERQPLFADCNAVAPETVKEIGARFRVDRLPFVDAGIIGPPPAPGRPVPRFYASGESVSRFEALRSFGLDVRPLSNRVGDASALKMAYGGINKGLQALGAALIAGAARAGISQALRDEMQESQPAVFQLLSRSLPDMYAKAYRWAGEMEEVAKFLQPESGAAEMFHGAAHLYEQIAREHAAKPDSGRIALLNGFLQQTAAK